MQKIYPDADTALAGLLFDGMLIAAGASAYAASRSG